MNILFCTVGFFSFIEGIGTLQAIFLILGVLLLIAEMFMPGFGIAGGSGLVLLIIGIVMTARTPFEAMAMVLLLILLVALMLFLILHSAKKGKLAKKLILWSSAKHEEGFSTSEDLSQMIGREGTTLTVLRPAGSADFGGRRLDVVSDGTYIEKGVKVKITGVEGRRIVVQPVEEQ